MKHIEDKHQEACFKWFHLNRKKYPGLGSKLVFHPANGGKRNEREGARLKRQGVKSGVSDIVFLIPKGKYHGMVIELKPPKAYASQVSKSQKEFLVEANEQGFLGVVCYGFDEVKEVVENYWSEK